MYKENDNRIQEINFAVFPNYVPPPSLFTGPLNPHSFSYIHFFFFKVYSWIVTYPSTLLNFPTIHQIGREEKKAKMSK